LNKKFQNFQNFISKASFKGYLNAIKRFVYQTKKSEKESETPTFFKSVPIYDMPTRDEFQSTPIMLATLGSHLDIVQYLVKIGADLTITNTQGHTVIEIAALKQNMKIVEFFLEHFNEVKTNKNDKNIVWEKIIRLLDSKHDDIQTSAAKIIEHSTTHIINKNDEHENNTSIWLKNCQDIYSIERLYEVLNRLLKRPLKETRLSGLFLVLNLIEFSNYIKSTDLIM
jgi:hypothetical protein